MPDLSTEPARVSRQRAMLLLCIEDDRTFAKVVDANPDLIHKLPGETRAKYRTEVIAKLLGPHRLSVAARPVPPRKSGLPPSSGNGSHKL